MSWLASVVASGLLGLACMVLLVLFVILACALLVLIGCEDEREGL